MTKIAFEEFSDEIVGERVLLARTPNGLPIRIAPSTRFGEIVAMITFRYGSTDLGFEVDGVARRSPEGVAHYLEHKLFEDEDLHVFERFGQRGAQVNAMTGFARTTYYFHASNNLADNLTDLLRLVSSAHLTEENVEKERGIIAQELRMYEDSPEYRGFFDLLRCFYSEHPVRNPVGGTVESIADIDVEELQACYRAFYRTGNAALSVAGSVDPAEVVDIASACELGSGAQPTGVEQPSDLGPVKQSHKTHAMDVARPRVLLGYKDRSLVPAAAERARLDLVTRILLDHLFGGASPRRERLYQAGSIDDSLSASYSAESSFGFSVVACESSAPEATIDAVREAFEVPVEIDEPDLERVRRKMLGHYVRAFESTRAVAMGHGEDALEGQRPFQAIERVRSVTLEDVRDRQREICQDDSFASVIVASASEG